MDSIASKRDVEQGVEILDIRVSKSALTNFLKDEILAGLRNRPGQKTLPSLLLYNERGLKLFEDITYHDHYYLTNTEISILDQYAASMAMRIEDGSIIVELGSGNLRKVNILLHALDRLGKKITYYALDLDRAELTRSLLAVPPGSFKNIRCVGLHGTYDDGRAWLRSSTGDEGRCILWLGSSAGNYTLEGAVAFLQEWTADALRAGKQDCMLIGLDGCKAAEKVLRAYNDPGPEGLQSEFMLNALWNANDLLGGGYFVPGEWKYNGKWNVEESRHEFYCEAMNDIAFAGDLKGIMVERGEEINVGYSYKFSDTELRLLWSQSGLIEGAQWANDTGDYYLHMLYKPTFSFHLGPPSIYVLEPAPTLAEWKELWAAWDLVTLGMIPRGGLLSKPISLCNPYIFYLGHIPAFLDMHVAHATDGKMTDPGREYQDIFQHKANQDVGDPAKDSWPALEDILAYGHRVRERIYTLYDPTGSVKSTPVGLQRALWLAFEYEATQLETLLHMLLQSEHTLPPPGVTIPDFASGRASERCRKSDKRQEEMWVEIPTQVIDIGINDPEDNLGHWTEANRIGGRCFSWGNEKPLRKEVVIPSFTVRACPITNGEYARYLHGTSSTSIPASWTRAGPVVRDGMCMDDPFELFLSSYFTKTVFGPVPMALAVDWPAIASYDELAECAAWMGGRIPTADEVRAVYSYAEAAEKTMAKAVNCYRDICDSPPCAEPFFIDLRDHNVGFKHWHPTPARSGGGRVPLGRCATGGAWEWTSSVLERHEGFRESTLCPEYTDTFDGKHNIVLGGSWATHPRIAGRKSFVNCYRRNSRYTWATAKIVAI